MISYAGEVRLQEDRFFACYLGPGDWHEVDCLHATGQTRRDLRQWTMLAEPVSRISSSNVTYSRCLSRNGRTSVVLPHWRGPICMTTEVSASAMATGSVENLSKT